jgi:hypothetical protein
LLHLRGNGYTIRLATLPRWVQATISDMLRGDMRLRLAGRLNFLKVLAEAKTRFALTPRQVLAKPGLGSVSSPLPHRLQLACFSVTIGDGRLYDILKPILGKKEDPIGIADNKIVRGDGVRPDDGATQDVRWTPMETLRPRR